MKQNKIVNKYNKNYFKINNLKIQIQINYMFLNKIMKLENYIKIILLMIYYKKINKINKKNKFNPIKNKQKNVIYQMNLNKTYGIK